MTTSPVLGHEGSDKMSDEFMTVRTAVIQAAPVLFDREATVAKTCDLIAEAGKMGANLIVFPEAFIPAYPRGLSFGMVVGSRSDEGRQTWQRYYANAVDIPSAATKRIGEAAQAANAYVAVGVIERDGGTLYCTMLYFGRNGRLLGKHRKLKPTGSERLIWGEGDGSTLTVIDTELGKVGGLICWENYMPLARYALYAQQIEIYVAPTWDSGDTWLATLQHIAREGGCWVIGCATALEARDIPENVPYRQMLFPDESEWVNQGDAVIYKPFGRVLAGPMRREKGVLTADINVAAARAARRKFDATGHYARPDIFTLSVDRNRKLPVKFD